MIAKTPNPPYFAVIFTSIRTEIKTGYSETAELMVGLANQQEGFLGVENARNDIGITDSYWKDLESIRKWKLHTEHLLAQDKGKAQWYRHYRLFYWNDGWLYCSYSTNPVGEIIFLYIER